MTETADADARARAANPAATPTAERTRPFGPDWPMRAAVDGPDPRAHLPDVLWSRGATRWYLGAGLALLWMLNVGASVIAAGDSALSAAGGILVLIVFSGAFLAAAPLCWSLELRGRLLVCAALLVLSLALAPWLGWDVTAVWTYVGVIVGMCVLPWRMTWLIIAGLAAASLLSEVLQAGQWRDDVLFTPAIVMSISMMMAAFARTLAAINQLRATQDRMAALAAERERGRVARDIHDILGHSLTVITVKAELAGRLVAADPARASSEIADVEALARGALADVRATVAGFRGVSVATELAAARTALAAAGIDADLPTTTDAVPPEFRELAGWVVREGVTNVVRHSGAARCRVRVDARSVEVADDGRGPGDGTVSTGLAGLRERVEAMGGRMTAGGGELGGFTLRVTR